ncbi:growth-regulating factor 4-like isoform X2 [Tasmannia lanceolata]|uniref:growth-regulating factor 4-like isoform X2 n=1 Tax=Tasmannia lanceolata TaxID=3420 RepID=UPI0040642D90
MDFSLQKWRNQHESDQQPCANFLLEHQSSGSALPLFVQEPNTNLSAFPDSTTTPRMGGFFSLAQWKELELQALIFKYMLAGASVPLDLILLIKKSLLNTPAYYNHPHQYQQYHYYQPAMLQTGYWGRTVMDAEPGRCRRTDGKKWRCSRDVVTGQKYCERHVHRGRNRSRKPVEIPIPTAPAVLKTTISSSSSTAAKETHFKLSGSSFSKGKTESGSLQQCHQHNILAKYSSGSNSEGQLLRHFFDDWPSLRQEPSITSGNASQEASTTHLSISIPGNSSSDFSLKLSTGDTDEPTEGRGNVGDRQPNWGGWGSQHEASMGGPLAEALRSPISTSSPTSVLHKPYGPISEASSIST